MTNKTKIPFFSIVTVCYNEEKNIKKTCESIIKQGYKNFEWIIIDGKSTDKTLEIIKKYGKKIPKVISEKDSGVYNAMNKGIVKTKGEYILFLNGGDYLKDKDVLQEIANFIQKDKKQGEIYYGDLLYDNGEIVTFKKSKLDKKFFKTKTISHQATFIKRQLFEKYGYYDEQYKIVADFDFWIRAIIKGGAKVKYLPIIVSVFDQTGISADYKLAKKQIKERSEVLIKHGLIGKTETIFAEAKWFILTMLKKLGFYSIIRETYRKIVKR
ncbi:glycosyltransferase [Candidatus Pacearchaeota archaeon]|nr:glycosyltransferase [Candidatus Pacearchaeota archaeon]